MPICRWGPGEPTPDEPVPGGPVPGKPVSGEPVPDDPVPGEPVPGEPIAGSRLGRVSPPPFFTIHTLFAPSPMLPTLVIVEYYTDLILNRGPQERSSGFSLVTIM